MALKAWHIYGLILIPVVLLLIGVTYGASERDGTEREEQVLPVEPDGPDGPSPGGPPGGPGGRDEGTLVVTAEDNRFIEEELHAPAGEEVTLELFNNGAALHNWSVPSEGIATELINGGESGTVTFTLDAGEYDYVCEVHPQEMQGTLIVE
ncbi:MAG: cupredoxin domain-containing protein [Dehalococcoidia bacterium]